eukprot:237680-Rhodomonas_salina.1
MHLFSTASRLSLTPPSHETCPPGLRNSNPPRIKRTTRKQQQSFSIPAGGLAFGAARSSTSLANLQTTERRLSATRAGSSAGGCWSATCKRAAGGESSRSSSTATCSQSAETGSTMTSGPGEACIGGRTRGCCTGACCRAATSTS